MAAYPGQGPDPQVFGQPAYGDSAFRDLAPGAPAHNGSAPALPSVKGAIKVPAVKPYFWVVKLLTTLDA